MTINFALIDILRHICNMYFSTTFVWDLIEYAKINGGNINELEKSLYVLKKEKYVSYDTMVKTFNYINKELKDDYLGLHVGEQISLKATAYVDSIMLHSKTLEEAFKNAIKYSKLISDALACSLKITDNHYAVIYEENPNWKVYQTYTRRQVLDIALLSNIKSLVAYTNYNYLPVCVNFSYEKPKKLYEYYRLFNCSINFNQAKTEIVFERNIIDRHSKKTEYGLLENLKAKIAGEIENLTPENELIYQLKKCILNYKPERIPIGKASQKLHLSKRTLQRKLKALNTSFKKVECGLQVKLAKTYLEEKQKSVNEISYLLGFSESSAFIRFFKSKTKLTPSGYYKNNIA